MGVTENERTYFSIQFTIRCNANVPDRRESF
jgi:hypothetical protein